MLYLIGLGLELNDISLNALNAIKKCKKLYLESYTSIGSSVKELSKLLKKQIIIADRELIENNSEDILKESKNNTIAIWVHGDPLIATTHINYIIDAKKLKIKVKVIHNVSIINAITETGLMLYNFGKTTSIPFNNENVKTPIEVINNNLKNNLHTLILLDLDPKNNKFLDIREALEYLIKNNINNLCVVCSALGTSKQEIKVDYPKELLKLKFNKFPQCLIIPGKLHFREEEALKLYNQKVFK